MSNVILWCTNYFHIDEFLFKIQKGKWRILFIFTCQVFCSEKKLHNVIGFPWETSLHRCFELHWFLLCDGIFFVMNDFPKWFAVEISISFLLSTRKSFKCSKQSQICWANSMDKVSHIFWMCLYVVSTDPEIRLRTLFDYVRAFPPRNKER